MSGGWLKTVLLGLVLLVAGGSRVLGQEAVSLSAADMTFVILITAIVVGGLVLIAWLQARRRAE